MNIRKLVLFPLLVVAYFFIHFWTDLFYFVVPGEVLKKMFLYFLASSSLYFGGLWVAKNKKKYTLLFCILLFLFLFYGSFADMAERAGIISFNAATSFSAIVVVLALFLLMSFIIFRLSERFVRNFLRFWMVYLIGLIIYDSFLFAFSKKNERQYLKQTQSVLPKIHGNKPPVFFLLFDMYPSNKVLKNYLHYDNDSIKRYLSSNNFFVTENARSLYEETYYSISSTFALAPINYLNDPSIPKYKKKLIAIRNINKSLLTEIFQTSGYIINNYSVFTIQNRNSPLQFNLDYHVDNVLTASTFFNRMYAGIEPDFIAAHKKVDISFLKKPWSAQLKADLSFLNESFDSLTDSLPGTTTTSFNYFHFMVPHPPTIFDSNGKENDRQNLYNHSGYDRSVKNFVAYTAYANQLIEKMVQKILKVTAGNAVIIIQGDHGYREFPEKFPDEVRLGVFNAVYLPGKNYRNMHDSLSTLQTVHQVLANQFYPKP